MVAIVPFERIVTTRLVMRHWTAADREPFATMNADPQVMRYFPAPIERHESDAFVDRIEGQFAEHGYGLWALERRNDGAFLGFTGLSPIRDGVPYAGAVEVGWRLTRPAWGHGYATEAARRAVRIGFADVGLDQLVSMTAVVNLPSRRVMERLGMTRDPADDFEHPSVPEGTSMRPHVLYRLCRNDWSAGA